MQRFRGCVGRVKPVWQLEASVSLGVSHESFDKSLGAFLGMQPRLYYEVRIRCSHLDVQQLHQRPAAKIVRAQYGRAHRYAASPPCGLDPERIVNVSVWLPQLYYNYPGANREAPFETMSQAQASGHFCVAAALLGYPMDATETFIRDFARDDIAALSHRVELLAQSNGMLARVEVSFDDGISLSCEVDRSDRLIPSVVSMSGKLKRLTQGAWRDGAADAVIATITGPEHAPVHMLSGHLRYAD